MHIFTIPGIDYDSNIYIIIGRIPTIIDTGTGFYSESILQTINKRIALPKIQQILLTHEHYDHVGGVQDIVQATGNAAKIYAHKDVVSKLRDGKSTFAEMLGGVMPCIEVDVPLTEKTELIVGDEPFQVLVTPGHSIGSVCFYNEKNGVLFSGDTVFSHGGFGRYDFPGGNFDLLHNSLERLACLDVERLYPGHGPFIEASGKDHVLSALSNIRSLI